MRNLNLITKAAVAAMAFVVFVDQASALTLRYRESGAWDLLSDGDEGTGLPGWGENPRGAAASVPVAGDTARINWGFNTVTLEYDAPAFDRLQIGVDESGVLEVNDGGVLTTINDVNVGHNNLVDGIMDVNDGGVVNVGDNLFVARVDATTRGFLNVNSGGVMNVGQHLWIGVAGTALVEITGTIQQDSGILGLGTVNAVDPAGGTATVNVRNGGLLALNNIHAGGTQSSIQPGSKIDFYGSGRMTLPGDFVEVLEGYRDANLLHGNGVAGAVDINLETSGPAGGDFNSSGGVDGNDFIEWQRNPNVGSLEEWESNFGSSGSTLTVVTAAVPLTASVPEPAALTLMLVSSLMWQGCRRKSR